MLNAVGPVLSDGTPLRELIDLNSREVAMRVLADPEIHRLELKKIFARTWQLVAHATEIPEPGDFVTRRMGNDQVIVARDAKGEVHVSLNVCPHRGMRICRADAGNARAHRCIYHGWAFRPDGSFIGAPIESEQMHGDVVGKDKLGLRKARIALYGGLVFATWDTEGPSFDEFLGDMKFYYDMLFCRTDGGLEVLGPPQRYIVPANWKTASEQSAADGYHTLTLHGSLFEMGAYGTGIPNSTENNAAVLHGVDIGSPQGHAMRCATGGMRTPDPSLSLQEQIAATRPAGITPELMPEMMRNLSQDQLQVLARGGPTVGGMFPNLLFLWINPPTKDGGNDSALVLHTYQPHGPDHFEFTNWMFCEKDTPEDLKRRMRSSAIGASGTSGTIEQDDAECWPHMSESARGVMGEQGTLKYQALLGENKPPEWTGPGLVYAGFSKDDGQWNWWKAWLKLMLD
ncbi:MAG: (2Fe-2S)-binding protein [Phenylobacterium sp.]|nr:(2Fe-2S)-binding protein [Phenylobacterium sp.]